MPDANSMVHFQTSLFATALMCVKTEGDGKFPDAERNLVTFKTSDLPLTFDVNRLRLYDLPREWWSTDYPVRFPNEGVDKVQPFQKAVATKSSLAKPYIVSLDTIVLQNDTGDGPDTKVVFDDSKIENRFTIFDNQLQVHKFDSTSGEIYFTRLKSLTKQPDGPVLHDFAPFTRLITRGQILYDVFDARTRRSGDFKGFPIGARWAVRFPVGNTKPSAESEKSSNPTRRPNPTDRSARRSTPETRSP